MRVRRSPHLHVEREEAGTVYLRERAGGNRAALNRTALRFLSGLVEPREVPDHPQVRRLLDLGFLVEDGHERRHVDGKLFARVAPLMFGCPAWREHDAADFVILGVPLDAGNRTAPGARYGPDALRQASAIYTHQASDEAPGVCQGWVDHEPGETILRGARLADAGELYARPGSGAEEDSDRLTRAVQRILASSARPVLVGGDHAISFGALRGVARRPTGLLHLDAHSDAARYRAAPHDYGNVVSRIVAELDVRKVLHVGVRGLGHGPVFEPPRRLALPPAWIRSRSLGELLELADPELDWYVSIDIDVVDPAFAPGTATPVPGGLTVAETKGILRAFGRARRVSGCDLVEVNPTFDQNRVTAILGCELLLTLMGAVWGGHK
jgi:agmatinase